MSKKLIFISAIALLVFGAAIFLKESNIGTAALWNISDHGKWLLPLVSVAAIIDSVNPCAFSILLLTIAFLFTIEKTRSDILKIGGFYILGILAVYVLIGLGILQVLHLFNTPHFMAKVGAVLLIAVGAISAISALFPSFPIRIKIPKIAHNKMAELMDKTSLLAAFFLGVLVGLCEFPCTGGPYLMVLGLLHDQNTYYSGIGYLLLYNLIFILPLVAILLITSDKSLTEKVMEWKRVNNKQMKTISGIAMIILGIAIFAF